jgi:signal transduction histidine kinase
VGVARAAALLEQHASSLGAFLASAQGKHLPAYLRELSSELATEREAMATDLGELQRNVEHIKEIVAMQQSYARRGGLTEVLDVRTLVEDSLRLNAEAFTRHGVTLVREFADVPPIRVDKHKVMQILVNLIRNAKYACDESPGAEKCVTVRIARSETSIVISVIDTGVGIPPENLTRIFNHGFTTRASGHGFGLHSSALAAAECGGSLRGESAGPGQGATFTLELPLVSSEALDAA